MNLAKMNVDEVMQAIIADEPDIAEYQDSLRLSLTQLKHGEFARMTSIPAQIRQKANLSQSEFAKTLGISVNTLKSWEQGQRQPSGSARVLLGLLSKRPELIGEIAML